MGFLRPVRMVKVGLLGLKADREKVLAVLHDANVVQIEPLRKDAAALLPSEGGGELQRRVTEQLLRFRTLKNALPARPHTVWPAYPSLESVLADAAAVTIDPEVLALTSEEDRLRTERKTLTETAALLEAHRYYREPLGLLRSRRLFAFFGEASPSAYQTLRAEVARIAEAAFLPEVGEDAVRFLLAVPSEQVEAVGRLAQPAGVKLTAVPALDGPIEAELPKLRARLAEVERRLGEILGRLGAIADTNAPHVAALEEALTIENRKFEALTRMGAGAASFALEGWVPERELAHLTSALAGVAGERGTLFPIPTEEEPPTLMDNPPGVRWFEFFIRFYALPKATEFDPTWIFAIAFPLFFGFMLGDAGYAIIILGFCLWMIAGFPGRAGIPSFIKSIPTLIMSPSSMQTLARTLVPGTIVGIGFGVVYNDWLGFHLPFYGAVIDPVHDVGKLLLLGGYFGLAMVIAGFLLGMAKALSHHHRREAVARFAGILLAGSVSGLGLMLLHRTLTLNLFRVLAGAAHPISLNAELTFVGILVAVVGFALLVVAEGFQGLMAVPEVVSHILSYSRLIGILLSAVILATIVNIGYAGFASMPTSSFGAHAALVFAGVLILVLGQVFVLILAVFEPGIQGARLIFVEHFSKFYEGNGRPFRAFGSRRSFTRPAYLGPEPAAPGMPQFPRLP